MNKVMLIGNVGQEPEVRYLDQGVCVAQIRLATTERGYTLQSGAQVPDKTDWHTVIFWRKLAETVEKYVHKGDKLYVEGKIQNRQWVDKKGETHRTYEIMADNMEMLTKKTEPATAAEPQQEQQTTPPAPAPNELGEYPF
ncbi:MAG: single-stranded DNA-binding protein [Bacteroidaceae bacterium]|nr:single-stranded DNA-binding protein [Bacteroidaceae bacterium]